MTERTTRTRTFVLGVVGTAIALSAAFFPTFFKGVTSYDDEGSLLVTVRQFLRHGSLYVHTHGGYGPFYFSLAGAIFRLTGQDPTLFTGRLVVLAFTAVSAGLFAAAVWRVTRNLAFSLLAQVVTYCVLAKVAGSEPMHPGSMVVLVLAALAFALACYVMTQSTAAIFWVGLATGALMMIKINVGIFALVAVVVVFVVGNAEFPKVVRVLVGVAALAVPFALMSSRLYQVATLQFAVVVSVGLLATYASLSVDAISVPVRGLLVAAGGAASAIAVSCVWPLVTGTSPGSLFRGVLLQPLAQDADYAQIVRQPRFELLAFAVTVGVVYAVLARREVPDAPSRVPSWCFDAGLGFAGLIVLGLVMTGGFGAWLPAIVVLPALALFAATAPAVRLAFRFLVPLAILQFLHVYPVVGSQVAWGRVAVCVPCVIAMAVAVERFPTWQQVGAPLRALGVGSLGLVLVVATGFLPTALWREYDRHVAIGLPGTRLVRVARSRGRGAPRPHAHGETALRHAVLGAALRQPLHLHGAAHADGLAARRAGGPQHEGAARARGPARRRPAARRAGVHRPRHATHAAVARQRLRQRAVGAGARPVRAPHRSGGPLHGLRQQLHRQSLTPISRRLPWMIPARIAYRCPSHPKCS